MADLTPFGPAPQAPQVVSLTLCIIFYLQPTWMLKLPDKFC